MSRVRLKTFISSLTMFLTCLIFARFLGWLLGLCFNQRKQADITVKIIGMLSKINIMKLIIWIYCSIVSLLPICWLYCMMFLGLLWKRKGIATVSKIYETWKTLDRSNLISFIGKIKRNIDIKKKLYENWSYKYVFELI